MTRDTVAVMGASGFVGSAFVERTLSDPTIRLVPLIHSSGNAARLARLGLDLRMVDLLSPASVADGLRDCTAVVNCARGGKEVLTRGFQNLLDASRTAGIRRFVHISSVAVYGDTGSGEIVEARDARPQPNTYGANKLTQDLAVEAAVKQGLPAVVLCPPNISGAHSPFMLEIVQALRSHQFALVDEGAPPCELVDVENLVHAMRRALDHAVPADGSRMFVTDCSAATWRDVIEHLMPLAESDLAHHLDRMETERLSAPAASPSLSIRKTLRHLLSSQVREALRRDPLLARGETLAKGIVRSAPGPVLQWLRRADEAPMRRSPSGPAVSRPLVRQQLRDVRYSCARARETLGYTPVVPFDKSMEAFRGWYAATFGLNPPCWPLLKELFS